MMFMYVFFPKVPTMPPKNNVLAVELHDDPAAPAPATVQTLGFPPFEGHLQVHQQ